MAWTFTRTLDTAQTDVKNRRDERNAGKLARSASVGGEPHEQHGILAETKSTSVHR
jgi:hypothetical protein